MAGFSEDDAQSLVCLKHNPKWNKRLYWVLNKLYDNLIPKKYQKRVGALLCTCDRRANLPPRNDPFQTVSRDELYQAAGNMDLFILTNNRHQNIDVLRRLMQWFRDDGLLPAQGSHQSPVPGQVSGVYMLLYILLKCIHGDYAFLDPPPPLNAGGEAEATDKVLEFLLEGCDHNLMGSIIGRNGKRLKPLQKTYKCHITLDKITMGDDQKIKVIVKKRSRSMETLERVRRAVEEIASEVVEEEDQYQEQRRRADEQHRQDFKELLHKTKEMSRTVTWNNILSALTGNVRHYSLTRAVGHNRLKRWFEEIQEEWVDPESEGSSASSGSLSSRAFDRSGPTIVHQNQFSDEEMEDTALKREPAGASGVSTNLATVASGPVPSTSGYRPESSPLMSAGASLLASSSGSASFQQPLSTAQEGRLNVGDRPSVCIVHDRSWVPTYQFTLTRCYQEINLEKKYGRAFSKFICSCESSVPDCLCHFESEAKMQESFKRVIDNIEKWPREVQDIMSPLVSQLKKGRAAETWHSLYRFVFLFDSILQRRTEYLGQEYRLPFGTQDSSEGSIVCQPEEENMDTSPSPGTSSVDVSSVRNTQNVGGVYRTEECYFKGKKNKALFQCVLNQLHDKAGFPRRYNMPFCKAVCICNDDSNSPPVYQSHDDLRDGCRNMKEKLSKWRGSSTVIIKPLITLLEQYLNGEREVTRALQKFVFYFNCVYRRDFGHFERKK